MFSKKIALILLLFGTVFLAGCLELFGNQNNERICNRFNETVGAFNGTVCASTLEEKFPGELSLLPWDWQQKRAEGIQKQRVYSFECNPEDLKAGVKIEPVKDCSETEQKCTQNGANADCGEKKESDELLPFVQEYNQKVCERFQQEFRAPPFTAPPENPFKGTICAAELRNRFSDLIAPAFVNSLAEGVEKGTIYSFECNPTDLKAGAAVKAVQDCGLDNCQQTGTEAKCTEQNQPGTIAENQPETCTTINNEIGLTGPNAVPMISFSTDWEKFKEYQVTYTGGSDFEQMLPLIAAGLGPQLFIPKKNIFLDGEQFLMALFWKLKTQNDSKNMEPFSFFVLLKQDNFSSQKLQQAFAEQAAGFANTPQWFKDEKTPFYKFAQSAMIEIQQPETPLKPGLYEARVSFSSFSDSFGKIYPLFSPMGDGQTRIGVDKITVELVPIEAEFAASPLYYISLDAGLPIENRDFGTKFVAQETNPVPLPLLTEMTSDALSSGSSETTFLVKNDFESINQANNKFLLSMEKNGDSIAFNPQQAAAVTARLPITNNSLYYRLIQNGEPLRSNQANLLVWSELASSKPCNPNTGFQSELLVDAVLPVCEQSAFPGFKITFSGPRDNETLLFGSIAALPANQPQAIGITGCNADTVLATPAASTEQNPVDVTPLEGFKAETMEQVFELVKTKKACVVQNANQETIVAWNQNAFRDSFEQAAEKLGANWNWCTKQIPGETPTEPEEPPVTPPTNPLAGIENASCNNDSSRILFFSREIGSFDGKDLSGNCVSKTVCTRTQEPPLDWNPPSHWKPGLEQEFVFSSTLPETTPNASIIHKIVQVSIHGQAFIGYEFSNSLGSKKGYYWPVEEEKLFSGKTLQIEGNPSVCAAFSLPTGTVCTETDWDAGAPAATLEPGETNFETTNQLTVNSVQTYTRWITDSWEFASGGASVMQVERRTNSYDNPELIFVTVSKTTTITPDEDAPQEKQEWLLDNFTTTNTDSQFAPDVFDTCPAQ